MSGESFFANQRKIDTPSGSISYVELGKGPVALFVHGVLLNGYFWRHQLEQLQGMRRCIAVDLMAHGNTEISATQDVSVTANAHMLAECLDALKIEQVDLVGNDSGGGVCPIFADDTYFDVKLSHWLERAIPGTKRRVELESARIFFPEERSSEFNAEDKGHWSAPSGSLA